MSWVAKNSITGTIYGKKMYRSAMECQVFIDKELIVLEYEMQRTFALEQYVLDRLSLKDSGKSIIECLVETFQKGLNEVAEQTGLRDGIKSCIEFTMQGKSQRELDEELHRIACVHWQRNNIIRCYETEQERFADGFDF